MNEETKKIDPAFQKKVNEFLKELMALQEKYKVVMRPIITTLGPDISIFEKKEETKEEEKVAE